MSSPEKLSLEISKVKSREEVFSKISEQVRIAKATGVVDEKTLSAREKLLQEMPIFSSKAFDQIQAAPDNEPKFSWIQTDKIVGRPSGGQNRAGWGFEYESRKGRIAGIARQLLTPREDEIENIFHFKRPSERIQLLIIEGPSGPMYSVDDGTHRVAATKLAGISEIPCEIREIKYPLERVSEDKEDFYDWQEKIDLGLIQGRIETVKVGKRDVFKLTVEKEILPWISSPDFIKISRVYEKLYPNSLNGLLIPRDACVDQVAYNYFVNGRWEEWKKLQKDKNKNSNKQ